MGEYATDRQTGERVKIGTCESMYYMRADQVRDVIAEPGNVDPIADAAGIRFRFPFPDEDGVQVGHFDPYDRRMRIDGLTPPVGEGWDHYSMQFRNDHGYLLSVPCPESSAEPSPGFTCGEFDHGLRIGRNGFKGAVFLCQQVWHDGLLVPVLECACGMKWRLRTKLDAAPLCEALMQMHERYAESIEPTPATSDYLETLRRILRGYEPGFAQSLGLPAAPVAA